MKKYLGLVAIAGFFANVGQFKGSTTVISPEKRFLTTIQGNYEGFFGNYSSHLYIPSKSKRVKNKLTNKHYRKFNKSKNKHY